jgi:hypothetical protein
MAIVFYEGFNYSTNDLPNIDTTYWSSSHPLEISYGEGRTNNQIRIPGHPFAAPVEKSISLSNFIDPLSTNSCFGLGFSAAGIGHSHTAYTAAPHRVKYLTFTNSANNIVLEINTIRTTYNNAVSIGLELVQSGTVVAVYDFSSVLGRSWGYSHLGNDQYIINTSIYLEFFIDPTNSNTIQIRASQDGGTIHGYLKNLSGDTVTSITGFSSLKSISFYGRSDFASQIHSIDDLYLSAGNNITECLFGPSVRIYRLSLTGNSSTTEWTANNSNSQHLNLNNADGDSNYIYSPMNTPGQTSIFDISNIASPPAGNLEIILKPVNIVRKTSINSNAKFVNVMTDGTTSTVYDLGPEKTVVSNEYRVISSFVNLNPATSNPWTIQDINNMQIGIKNLGVAS